MSTKLVVKDEQNLHVERVYYTGSQTLVAGQPFCFQESPATASSTKGFPLDVEVPNTNNERVFAGIVHPRAVGVTGPAYIDIVVPRPGDILQVLVSNGADLSAGDLLKLNYDVPTAAGQELGAFDTFVAITATGSVKGTDLDPLIQAAIADMRGILLESVGSSTAAARTLKWVRFL